MLPSRGVIRSGQAMRLRQMAAMPRSASCARTFATAPRQPAVLSRPPLALPGAWSAGRRATTGPAWSPSASYLPASTAAFSLYPWRSSKKPETPVETEAAVAAPAETVPTPTPAPAPAPASEPAPEPVVATPSPPVIEAVPAATTPAPDGGLAELLDGGALLDMPEQIGYLHAMGLDFGWGPTSMCQWMLEHVHVYSGLPWWASIGVAVLLFRGTIFLPSLTAAEQSARFQKLRQDPKYAAAMTEMQQSAMRGGPAGQSRGMEMRMTMKRMQAAAGVSTWKMFIPMINVPFGYGMFRLLRSMTLLPVPGLEDGGLLWIKDLTVPDPYFALPIASATIMYLIFRNNIKYMAPEQAQMMKMLQIVITPISILVTVKMNAGLTLFFFMSSVLQMLQTWLWHQPWLRNWKGLPPLHTLLHTSATKSATPTAFRLAPESTWQAPRATFDRDAMAARDAAEAAAAAGPSTVDVVKKSWNKMMGTAKSKQGAAKDKQKLQEAESYEKKRAMEEEEALYRRREAERQYREMKKNMARSEANYKQ